MAVRKEWSEWWRRFLGSSPEGNDNAAVDILRRRARHFASRRPFGDEG